MKIKALTFNVVHNSNIFMSISFIYLPIQWICKYERSIPALHTFYDMNQTKHLNEKHKILGYSIFRVLGREEINMYSLR